MILKSHLLDDWTVIKLLAFHERFSPYLISSPEKCFLFLRDNFNVMPNEYPFGLGDEKSKSFLPITRDECELLIFLTNSYNNFSEVTRGDGINMTLPVLNFHFRNAIDSKLETLLPRVVMHNDYQSKKSQLWKRMTVEEVMNEIPPELEAL